MSIQVKNLIKTYGSQKALASISFETQSNHIIGFLGPNGAGKSTTMKILSGILPFDQGECLINGINIHLDPIKAKKIIGYLPENNPLYLDMYVQEILTFEANLHGILHPKNRIQEVISLTGLTKEQHKRVNQLSKGYRQRVGLAMAIIHDPRILILDEPTSGLDPNQILEIRALIKELSKNKTVLLSTHIMQEVEILCDEIIILDRGILKDHFLKSNAATKFPNQSMEEIFVQLTHH
ncbi:ATP-binding cassette domain-containing protein [Sphingobacterium pedocola]|uniref:Multidrug ABC transporter ATP-binding protein n=1 Tax=Sphingobacterium pedocola TaxID=2082722 RepID=A0ABR9TCU1_9SPHI|nr:ATP-binding cassette domain-containing protein [Sphingobacterium pedocola]MBE8723149.1 multidrug ABC transporter ATP-binding protein [Sphingobacterium pedocola]